MLASLGDNYEPNIFAIKVTEHAHVSHAAMAIGSVSKDDAACEIFEARLSAIMTTVFATVQAVSARKSKGVNAKHLDKVWCIPHDNAARTLSVTTNLFATTLICPYLVTLGLTIGLCNTGRLKVISSLTPCLSQALLKVHEGTSALNSLSLTKVLLHYIQ